MRTNCFRHIPAVWLSWIAISVPALAGSILHLQPGSGTTPTFTSGLLPGDFDSVFIDPATTRTLNLWSAHSTVQNLTIGTTVSGTAELRVRTGETLDVLNEVAIQSSGKLTVGSSAAASSYLFNNAGTVRVDGQLSLTGAMSDGPVVNSGTITVGGTVNSLSNLQNQGSLQILNGGWLDAFRISNSGTVTQEAGSLVTSSSISTWSSWTAGGQVTADSFSNGGTLNLDGGQIKAAADNSGTIRVAAGKTGAFTAASPLGNYGTVEVDGTLELSHSLVNQGTLNIAAGGTLSGGALFNYSGGTANINGRLTSFDQIENSGSVTLRGSIGNGTITNDGTLQAAGRGSTIAGTLTNNGLLQATNTTLTLEKAVVNSAAGTIKNTGSTINFLGGLTNDGAYISDPADNYFNDLTVSETGYLVGGAGDRFLVKGNFTNRSQQGGKWDTENAEIAFLEGGDHTFDVLGSDLGNDWHGYRNNFSWGSLRLGAGQTLTFNNPGGKSALYVKRLILDGGAQQLASIQAGGLALYFDPNIAENAYLLNTGFQLGGGGTLAGAPTPEPGTLLLLAGALLAFRLRRRA